MRAAPLVGRRERGFTLLELIAVLAIAALVMGVSAPAMQRLYQSAQYRSAVSDVVSELNAARIQAIRSGTPNDVMIDPVARSITRGQQVHSLPESFKLTVLGSRELNRDGVGVIRFYADGASSGGNVTVTHANGMSAQVQVDWLLGRVSLCKQDCGMP
ncbi:MAG: prepilin-type N-terminal cleavage/methylation domain-containing protein [Halioglobus sp.]|nr:prepilin-type N-terminal cleavage/methylation domain-containing protein [Halioglobus sp.]